MNQELRRFRDSLGDDGPPQGCPDELRAVWHGLRGEWMEAHRIAQEISTPSGAWVHAWLHRIEGDETNAAYWYRRAGRRLATGSADDEGIAIAKALIEPDAQE